MVSFGIDKVNNFVSSNDVSFGGSIGATAAEKPSIFSTQDISNMMACSGTITQEDPVLKGFGKIAITLDALINQQGLKSNAMIGTARTIQSKIKEIGSSYINKIQGLKGKLQALQFKHNVSPEEIKKIQKQIEATQKEAQAKAQLVEKLVDKLVSLDAPLKQMEDKGISTNEIEKLLGNIISNINIAPSDFTGEEKPEEIDNKIKENILGKNAKESYKDQESKINSRIQELQKDPEKNKAEINALKIELELIKDIQGMFSLDK